MHHNPPPPIPPWDPRTPRTTHSGLQTPEGGAGSSPSAPDFTGRVLYQTETTSEEYIGG